MTLRRSKAGATLPSRPLHMAGALACVAMLLQGCASAGAPAARTMGPIAAADSSAIAREQQVGGAARGTLSVAPFVVTVADPSLRALGFALADLLTTDLARSSSLALVERGRLDAVLRELDLVKSGRVDSASAPRVGRLVGAERLVLGGLDTLPGGVLRVGVRVAEVASGQVARAIDAQAPLRDVLAAEKALAFQLFDALGVTLSPAERALVSARPTQDLAALLAYGRGLEAELGGDRRRAAVEYQRAIDADPSFTVPRERLSGIRTLARTDAPGLLPGLKPINHAIAETVDRLNRPLDFVTSFSRPSGGPSDPTFPSTVVTVVITVRRP